jgi:hypothetical protein
MPSTWTFSDGQPADSIGVDGDLDFDRLGRFIWGPKKNGTWTGTANNANPLYASPQTPNQLATGWGPSCQYSGQTMGTTAGVPAAAFFFPGTNIPYTFTPPLDSALVSIQATNFGSTGATVFFYLQNLTTGQSVASYNNGNGLAAGQVGFQSYSNVPLKAGNTYQFQGIRAAAGATFMQINPQILIPSSIASSAVSWFSQGFVSPATNQTIAAGGTVTFQTAGVPPQTGYYKNAASSYIYYMVLVASGSGTVAPYFYNETISGNGPANIPSITLTSTPTTYTFGPFAANQNVFNANSQQRFGLYNASGGATVNANSYMTMQVGQ